MWVQATLTVADLEAFVARAFPLSVELDSVHVTIAAPTSVVLVADLGLRLAAHAKLRVTIVGIHVPLTVELAEVVLVPTLQRRQGRDTLDLLLRVEELGLKNLPKFVDHEVTSRVRAALDRPILSWDFGRTLDFTFQLPAALESMDALRLHATHADLKIGHEGLTLACTFALDVHSSPDGVRTKPA